MNYLRSIQDHFDNLLGAAEALQLTMWPAVLDVRTRRYPEGDHAPKRVYRLIGAPRGSTLYWDQPSVVAAHVLSDLTGESRYADGAEAYTQDFLARCIGPNGVFQWGNHCYYDVFEQRVVEFHGGPHELRPLTPAWELFHALDPEATATNIRTMAQRHVYDPESGGFNRHDDQQKSHAFIEAGAILVESLAWLYGKTGEADLQELALRIAGYSYRHRGEATGLLINEPDHGRWDSKVATTESGLWANSLLRAAEYTGNPEFRDMASAVTRAYHLYGYDGAANRYFGQLDIINGKSVVPSAPGYWPRQHANPWNTDQWPTHDYPMAMAEAALSLHASTGEALYTEAIQRWAQVAVATSPGRTGEWAYAEDYGRCIHFLTRAGRLLDEPSYLAAAGDLASEACARLLEDGMFTGYPGEHLYESVDGVGYLLLALISLETGVEPPMHGFGF